MTIGDAIEQKQFDKLRFDRLVKARDNLNTSFHLWMTFFTVAIGALFVGYYTMKNKGVVTMEIVVVSILGYFISLIWHWSCKGYYWWIINWINLIIDCERNLPKRSRIYSCFINKDDEGCYCNPLKPANISTAKLLGLFSFGVVVAWGFLVLNNLQGHSLFFCIKQNKTFYLISITISIILSILLCLPARFFKHNMKNHKNKKLKRFLRK